MKDTLLSTKPIETLDDLIEEARQPTEIKPTQAQQQPAQTFIDQPEIRHETEEIEVEEDKPEMTPQKLKSNAEFMLGMVNIAQKSAFGFGVQAAYKKKLTRLYGSSAIQRAEMVEELAPEELTETDKGIKAINAKFEKVMATLPMNEDEKELWYPVIEEFVRKNQGKIPDNFYSYLALSQSLGTRLLAVLTF